MTTEMVAQVRRFDRTLTQRIGVLNENFLASDRSLGSPKPGAANSQRCSAVLDWAAAFSTSSRSGLEPTVCG